MRTARTLRTAAVLAATLLSTGPARASFTPFFSAVDAGAGSVPVTNPETQLPLSTAEAAHFNTAASQLGSVTKVDLGTAVGALTQASFTGGLTIALDGVRTEPQSPVSGGIVTANPNPIVGFSVVPENAAFLRVTPDATNPAVTVATATFTFATPVQAFGAYVLGLGTQPGAFHLLVYDGGPTSPPSSFAITGDAAGGAQFVGFTDPGAGVSKVVFQLTGFSPASRDIVGFDGISFAVVPEPSASVLLAVGGLFAAFGSRYLVRR